MLEELKRRVFDANLALVKYGLVIFTWGNASEMDRESKIVAIKPSGVSYDDMTADDIVLVNLDGKTIEGDKKPSSDTATHLELYRSFPEIGGVVHTHSTYATAFAQAARGIPLYGTTHADRFFGEVPCTRPLTKKEVDEEYEHNTGVVIAERMRGTDMSAMPACLVCSHGPFTWGKSAAEAAESAAILEECAKMALFTEQLAPTVKSAAEYLAEKHFLRKHGRDAYYGQ